ncbi:MAG TPA: tetraacyldisaccharide 4'-kinase [Steroidobacteraceae bacterium]|nr:tetraacyldisaccharide 4'-kinase [Steroidobacteraceae bacterium]
MEQRLTKLWYSDAAGVSWLQPLSWLYGGVVRLRRWTYAHGWQSTHSVGKPVVVVGNLTVGGTGKTPLVIWLARQLSERGLKVGIVSRGYGSAAGEAPRPVTDRSSWREVGDEPVLLHRSTRCATVVGRDRVAAAETLVSQGVDVIIADDGLQHLRLARNCEIVVIDGARGFGNQRMLPAGPLREPLSRLADVDLIVVNGAAEHSSLRRMGVQMEMTLRPGEAQRLDRGGSSRPLESFRGQAVHAVAGIGNPARFFRDLRGQELDVIEHPFADHHPFAPRDLAFGDTLPVLMTEKDAVKCCDFAEPHWWSVPATAAFSDGRERELLAQVLRKIGFSETAGG